MLFPKKRNNQYKKIISFLLVLAILLAAAKFTAGRQDITLPEEILQVIAAPVQGAFQYVTRSVQDFVSGLKSYRQLLQENKELRKQLAENATLKVRLTELRKENMRLRKMLELQDALSYEMIAAEVIARDPDSWFNMVTINKGKKDNVEPNTAVITTEGLIGYVYSVSYTTANVLLLTDSRPGVSALVQRSREPGVVGVVEYAPDKPGYLQMRGLPRDANILAGDTIITSGLGGIFPKGLVIGHVLETGVDELGLTRYAFLQPAANFNRLEEVFVIKSNSVSSGSEAVYPGGEE